jgi:hypothetical protein
VGERTHVNQLRLIFDVLGSEQRRRADCNRRDRFREMNGADIKGLAMDLADVGTVDRAAFNASVN